MKASIELDISSSFQSACEMFNMLEQYVLQSFIDKVSIYGFVAKHTTFNTLASSVFSQFINNSGKSTREPNEDKRAIGAKHIKQLFTIILSRFPLSKKEEVYNILLQNWYEEFNRFQQYTTGLFVNNSFTLSLSKDMVLMCDICKCTPSEILQFFINQVHLPMADEMEDAEKYSPATCFFLECSGQD